MTSSSTGVPKTGSGNSPDAASGWNSSPNSAREEVVDDAQHLRPRAVVPRQRQQRLRVRRAARGTRARPRAGSRRSTGTRRRRRSAPCRGPVSRSTSSHWSRFVSWNSSTMIDAEAQLLALAQRLGRSRRRSRARSCRSSKSSADSRSFAAAYASAKRSSSSCSSSRSRERELVERGLLDGLARLLVRRRALAARAQAAAGRAAARGAARQLVERERLRRGALRAVGRARSAARHSAASRQLGEPLVEPRPLAELQLELAAGRAQRLVDARQHPAQPARRRRSRAAAAAPAARPAQKSRQRGLERLAADHASLALVEHAEARIEARRERVRLQEAVAEAVDGRDPGAVEPAREVVPAELVEPAPGCGRAAPRRRAPCT